MVSAIRRRHVPSLRNRPSDDYAASRPPTLVDYRRPFEALGVEHERRQSEQRANMRPRESSTWFVADAHEMSARRRHGITGRDRLRRLNEAFAAIDVHVQETEKTSGRSPDQRWFFVCVLHTLFFFRLTTNAHVRAMTQVSS